MNNNRDQNRYLGLCEVHKEKERLVSHFADYDVEADTTPAHARRLLQLDQKTPILLPKEGPDFEPALNPILADDRHLMQLVRVLTILACPV